YRDTVKNTMEFDPEVLKRFVNFMNNPDEETAVAQFGKGDKYFGVCTLMVTMPGLPMFGHGQIEGFEEKYGMEYTKAYKNEEPDYGLIEGHRHDIFPLMKKRYLFSGIENFCFYDVWNEGVVNENIFAYSNRYGDERAIVFYNNKYENAAGWIKESCRFAVKDADGNIHQETRNLADGLGLSTAPDTFLIFQEQHSGLWYIRNVAELREHGMFTMLNGFQYQVLWNMSEVRDDETGKWRTLCTTLNGKGVKNIDVALKEIFLKDLYASLEKFASEELITAITSVAAGKEKDTVLKTALKDAKEAGTNYFDTLITFINGNYGAQNILKPAATAAPAKKAVAGAKKATAKTAAEKAAASLVKGTSADAWKNFEKRIKLLISLARNKALAKEATKAQKSFGTTMAEILSDEEYVASLAAYLMAVSVQDILGKKTTAADTQKLITLWRLDRKLRDLLVDQGHDENKLFTIFRSLRETTCIADMGITAASWKKDAAQIVDYLTRHELAWELLGLNTFGDTVWYNKEKAEVTFASAFVLYTLCAAKPAQYESLEKLRTLIADAAEKSEYKVELLVKGVGPAEKKPTAAKKTAEKKPTAKKTTAKKPAATTKAKKTDK
ncbi:MAG: alpha-amylase, partial [Treponemataceae bacterium]|nr:alpha-amylase [Treponemataceae bacterium]